MLREVDVQIDCHVIAIMPNYGVSIATSMNGLRYLPRFLHAFRCTKIPIEVDDRPNLPKLYKYSSPNYEPFQIGRPINGNMKVIPKEVPENGYIVPYGAIDN